MLPSNRLVTNGAIHSAFASLPHAERLRAIIVAFLQGQNERYAAMLDDAVIVSTRAEWEEITGTIEDYRRSAQWLNG